MTPHFPTLYADEFLYSGSVVTIGRNTAKVTQVIGASDNLLLVQLDVNNLPDAEASVKASIEKFGRIDVLVNNVANFYAGYFEELSSTQIERQINTNLIGPMNVPELYSQSCVKHAPVTLSSFLRLAI
jgi:NAD(P)-dependent dehydrogenase (short-subunit alcohol dehydrogenase family)